MNDHKLLFENYKCLQCQSWDECLNFSPNPSCNFFQELHSYFTVSYFMISYFALIYFFIFRYCIHRSGTYNIHVEYCTCRKKDGCNTASGFLYNKQFLSLSLVLNVICKWWWWWWWWWWWKLIIINSSGVNHSWATMMTGLSLVFILSSFTRAAHSRWQSESWHRLDQ